MHTQNLGRTSPLVYEPEIERVARRNLASWLEATLASNQTNQPSPLTPTIETDSMANHNSNQNQNQNLNQNQFQSRGTFYPAQNIQPIPQEQPCGNVNARQPTPPFRNQNPNNTQRTPQQHTLHRQASLPINLDDRNVNSDRRGNRDRGNPANEDPLFNIDDLRNAIPDDEPYSVPGYQSPERVSIHTEHSDDGGYYDNRVDDDEDMGVTSIEVTGTMLENMKMKKLVIKMQIMLGMKTTGMGIGGMTVTKITANHEIITKGTEMTGFTTTTMATLFGFLVSWEEVIKGVTKVAIEEMIEEMLEVVIEEITEGRSIKRLTVHNVVNNLHGE
ncbi:hypothetical protein Hdeb2414_s0012g00386641 [Helianthus debilis subsp. tardiflorus]